MSIQLGDAAKAAVDTMEAQGFILWDRPELEVPHLPADLTSLGDEALMDLWSVLVAWSDYTNGQLSAAQVDERSAERRIKYLESQLMVLKGASSKSSVTLLKAEIAVDPKIQKLEDELDVLYAYRKMVESIAQNLERDSSLISRELTRRTSGNQQRKGWTQT